MTYELIGVSQDDDGFYYFVAVGVGHVFTHGPMLTYEQAIEAALNWFKWNTKE